MAASPIGDESVMVGTAAAAARLGVSIRQLQRLAQQGLGRKVGGRWKFTPAELDQVGTANDSQPADQGSLEQAVVAEVGAMPASVRRSSLATLVTTLACRMDHTTAARDSAALSRELRAAMGELAELMSQVAPRDQSPLLAIQRDLLRKRAEKLGLHQVSNPDEAS